MPPAARLTDMHVCPMVTPGTPPVPHVGGPIVGPGAPTVLIGGLPAAKVGDMCVCVGPPDSIVKGSMGVMVMGAPAARMGDSTAHGGSISAGLPTVMIGDLGMGSPGGVGAIVGSMLAWVKDKVAAAVDFLTPGSNLQAAVNGVNPNGGTVNCGNIIDAASARLSGRDPDAVASTDRDGSFTDIEGRFNTTLTWGSDFQSAYDAVQAGGPGTQAIIGIGYSGGTGSHVVLLANDGGTVGIVEGQNWGAGNPPEVITDVDRANERYNSDGGSNIGWGIVH